MAEENSPIGKHIGNYRIIAELGSGGFADVYQAQHLIFTNEPPVAIKLLYARLKAKEREQFIQEAQLLRMLRHPHILPILDAGFSEGTPYIVMEYAPQGSLQDRLDQKPGQPFPIAKTTTILTDIGEALYYAHQQNIVHRDLKPDNILFNAKGEALLADFGLATILSSARTANIGSAGTPAYMAPEMFAGQVSVKSDQYTLGCIAYELLTGRKPFEVAGASLENMWFQHAKVEPTAPTQFNPQIPSYIEQAILIAMAKDRNNRHPDVLIFLKALQASQKSAQEWFDEGVALFDLNRYEEVIAAYEQALRLDPNNAIGYYNKGIALRKLNRNQEAIAAYEQAIRLDPNYASSYTGIGVAFENLQKYEEAIVAHEQAIRLDPNYALAYYNKGVSLGYLQRYEEEIVAYEQAIRLDPNRASTYYNKCTALLRLGRYEEAIAACEQALRLDPNDVSAYYNKGIALRNLRRYEEAIVAYEQAIRLDPSYALAYNGKGNVLNQLGRKKEAQQAFEKARELGFNPK